MRILSLKFQKKFRSLKFILNYTAGSDVIILLRWDNRSNHSARQMIWCLTNKKLNFAFVIARYKISCVIFNKITRHSAIPSTWVRSICLYLANSYSGSLDFLLERKAPSFIKKDNIPWERSCVFSYCVKMQLRSLTQVSHVIKKIKNRWVKKTKKTKEKSKLHCNCHRSILPRNSYTIIPSPGLDGGERTVGTMFHGAVSLLIVDCAD